MLNISFTSFTSKPTLTAAFSAYSAYREYALPWLCQREPLVAEFNPHSGANTAVAVVDTVATADDAAVAVDIGGKVLKEAG